MTDEAHAVQWRVFLRALAEEIDTVGGTDARDALLRGAGLRIATLYKLSPADDLGSLRMEMNDVLADWGWGSVTFDLDDRAHALFIIHSGLPHVGSAGDPPGTWMAAVLEGLYEGWMSELRGSKPDFVVQRERTTPETVTLRYGRG